MEKQSRLSKLFYHIKHSN